MTKALVWTRRSLRLHDHTALSFATQNYDEAFLVFVFDKNILSKLEDKKDHRVTFIHETLEKIKEKLPENKMYILYGDPKKLIPQLAKDLDVEVVCTHEDYELYARERDRIVKEELEKNKIDFKTFKDHVIFDASEIRTGSGDYYRVFTPYKNTWFKTISEREEVLQEKRVKLNRITYKRLKGYTSDLSLKDIGFERTEDARHYSVVPNEHLKKFHQRIEDYNEKRDFPAIRGTSKLSAYLRFGQVSIRELVRKYWPFENEGENIWLSELCWRDFYFGLLKTFPHVEKYAYNEKYEKVPFYNNKEHFKMWCEGKTGVPIVDAGMRELNQTGWMHNRVRMIVASYLTKILIIDWRWGEEYFAKKLIDFDLSANNGGWQWSASTGCDAAPYFRVFNPYRQSERFDKEAEYIKEFCPELKNLPAKYIHEPTKITEKVEHQFEFTHGVDYPKPIVDYSKRRQEVIKLFKDAPYE
jgi:deoxyribodipyrimidine photo-lyase